jgi:hypothetical protein
VEGSPCPLRPHLRPCSRGPRTGETRTDRSYRIPLSFVRRFTWVGDGMIAELPPLPSLPRAAVHGGHSTAWVGQALPGRIRRRLTTASASHARATAIYQIALIERTNEQPPGKRCRHPGTPQELKFVRVRSPGSAGKGPASHQRLGW